MRKACIALGCLAAEAAFACPFCDTETGWQVRQGIGDDFGSTLLSVLAPFVVVTSIIAGLGRLHAILSTAQSKGTT